MSDHVAFVALCKKLRALGAVEVADGGLRAVFAPPAKTPAPAATAPNTVMRGTPEAHSGPVRPLSPDDKRRAQYARELGEVD